MKMKQNKLHELIAQVDEWGEQYHTNKKGEVVFQNKRLYSNIRFTNKSLHEIQKHSRGFDTIPDVVQNPDEVWSKWKDPNTQLVVLRNYIKFSKLTSYIVQTEDGQIIDAFTIPNSKLTRYRKGLIL
jgi:hypothetical protein